MQLSGFLVADFVRERHGGKKPRGTDKITKYDKKKSFYLTLKTREPRNKTNREENGKHKMGSRKTGNAKNGITGK